VVIIYLRHGEAWIEAWIRASEQLNTFNCGIKVETAHTWLYPTANSGAGFKSRELQKLYSSPFIDGTGSSFYPSHHATFG
jgi:hypothetical protein